MAATLNKKKPGTVTIRLRVPVGIIFPEQLDALKEVAEKYDTRIHLTVRKSIEIPRVPYSDLLVISTKLAEAGLEVDFYGDNVRNVVACPGLFSCPNALIDTQPLGLEIDTNLGKIKELPSKLKIAVAGCPNGCTHPRANDIGIAGFQQIYETVDKCEGCGTCLETCREGAISLIEHKVHINGEKCIGCGQCARTCKSGALSVLVTGYRMYVGGNMGRHPSLGQLLAELDSQDDLISVIERFLSLYVANAASGERTSNFVARWGIEKLRRELNFPSQTAASKISISIMSKVPSS